ncbi:MAG: type II toxin-antitoxin system RelE/ParE family toxin [Rhodocyclaceae bacterium]
MAGQRWVVRLAAAADSDFKHVLRWTVEHFGSLQAQRYAEVVSSALTDLTAGPEIIGARQREELGADLFILHVTRKGRKGRHFIVFRMQVANGQNSIDVLRILHDSMDLEHESEE